MGKMIWASFGFKGEGSSEQCPATAGYRARRGGSTKKEKGPSWDGFSFVLGQCVEYNMADHHIPLTHMVWIWGRMDCPDG